MALQEYSVRLRAFDGKGKEYHFIVPVRAADEAIASNYAIRFIAVIYKITVADYLVRHRGCALPTWCKPAKRVHPEKAQVGSEFSRKLKPTKAKGAAGRAAA